MAKKFRQYNSETKESPKQQFLKEFTEALIQRMEEIKASANKWEKGWIDVEKGTAKSVGGHEYTGSNAWYLNFVAGMAFSSNTWGTFNALTSLKGENNEKVSINKGAHARTIIKPYEIYFMKREDRGQHPDMKPRISPEQFNNLSEEEKKLYNFGIDFQSIKVFNIDQTNLKEVNPSLYKQFTPEGIKDRDLTNEYKFKPLDELMDKQTWVCTIKQQPQNEAYFSPFFKEIVVPVKEQFERQPEFYATLLHEMSHSTMLETNREVKGRFGSPEYAREELVAELSAAFSGSKLGITTSIEQDNSAHYLEAWLTKLSQDPEYLKDVLDEVEKATKVIDNKLAPYMEKQEIILSAEEKVSEVDMAVSRAFAAISQFNEVAEGVKPIVLEEKNKVVLSNELLPNQVEMLKHYAEVLGGTFNARSGEEKASITFEENNKFGAEICADIIKGATKEAIIEKLSKRQSELESQKVETKQELEKTPVKKSKGISI